MIEESLPDVVAAWIDWLVNESGWTVSERERPGSFLRNLTLAAIAGGGLMALAMIAGLRVAPAPAQVAAVATGGPIPAPAAQYDS